MVEGGREGGGADGCTAQMDGCNFGGEIGGYDWGGTNKKKGEVDVSARVV